MKAWPIVVMLAVGGSSLHSQGTILFNNYVPSAGVDAPVFNSATMRISGPEFVAQLFAGPVGTPHSSLEPVGIPVPFGPPSPATGLGRGYLDEGVDLIRVIPTLAVGSPAFVEMRVWSVNGGATWEQAYHSGRWDVSINWSGIVQVTTGDATHPAPMVGLQGFVLLPAGLIPEPSAGWLLLAGVCALSWRGRKRQ